MNQELENAYDLISNYLTNNNQHTLGKLLDFGLERHKKEEDDVLYSAMLLAKSYILQNGVPLEVCAHCGTTGEGASAWGGWCHDCDASAEG